MSLQFDHEETDCLLAAADEHLVDVLDRNQPNTLAEILGAVNRTPINDAKAGTAWIAPQKGAEGYCGRERVNARVPLLLILHMFS